MIHIGGLIPGEEEVNRDSCCNHYFKFYRLEHQLNQRNPYEKIIAGGGYALTESFVPKEARDTPEISGSCHWGNIVGLAETPGPGKYLQSIILLTRFYVFQHYIFVFVMFKNLPAAGSEFVFAAHSPAFSLSKGMYSIEICYASNRSPNVNLRQRRDEKKTIFYRVCIDNTKCYNYN